MVISIRELQKFQAQQEEEARRRQAISQRYPWQREWRLAEPATPKKQGILKFARYLYEE